MDLLIVEPLDEEVLDWLEARHAVVFAPQLVADHAGLRRALAMARAAILPPSVALDATTLQRTPRLRIVGRLSVGAENIDLDACSRSGVEIMRPVTASAAAEAEFVVGAMLAMLRRVPILNGEGLLVGRELGDCTVGVVGVGPALRPLAALLNAFGARVLGYDPGMHPNDPDWARLGVQPVGLHELMASSDAVAVLLDYYSRYRGLFGERLLSQAKRDQVLVSLAHSRLFDETALAKALSQGPLSAAWLDSLEPGAQDPGKPLRHLDTLQITPRVSGTTQGSRVRSAWAVAQRIDQVLSLPSRSGPAASLRRAGSAVDVELATAPGSE